jgi:GNAT superfamily N-acetyltransferase
MGIPFLSSEIVDQIIFAMENQEDRFLFDMERLEVISEDPEEELEDKPSLVTIPRWSSAEGFMLMEKFVAGMNNPHYRQQLSQALGGGKGVFRRFKDVLHSHGPLEKLWYNFKEREMRQIVRDWFRTNKEALLLDALGPEPEETEDLVLADFPVRIEAIETLPDESIMEACFRDAFEMEDDMLLDSFIEESLTGMETCDEIVRILASTPDGEFAALAILLQSGTPPGMLVKLPLLYVDPSFRGLGIAKLLLEKAAQEARRRGAGNMLVDVPGKGEVLLPWMEEAGFSIVRRSCILKLGRYSDRE